ncbi:hypothetical protein SAICODRAFT_6940 [Saitoella complicata NRRL Y-17804]|uniref:AAA+ ATPase domain-containing protein n=1 Tax=Saitoella complicata (strain BCRC 22490 / CBS 7301 / JCM 7358 / NBRC 10748 / NRRL Y-17804) TaxID=698492 RepID=A0A0E9NLY0_SAICN|nr:uncharacterized protein SAICODRAFT_6940 [Saitoella complicata NRRL Y-17804]ODQ53687.1 hypothetical protein SAICODRAFT_6940 [Saitoella complicata NRRL Y-17804]GAO50867.1 hypothetical protein G7K_4986-t1 [Saitoella complicata NRRL Y-17804]
MSSERILAVTARLTIHGHRRFLLAGSPSVRLRTTLVTVPHRSQSTTAVAISDPLVAYQTLVKSGRLQTDESQFRAAIHLHKLYERLLDYRPPVDFQKKLALLNTELLKKKDPDPATRKSFLDWLGRKDPLQRESLALVRILSQEEEVYKLSTPRGLILCGEVGTGKSMLMDLFMNSFPSRTKRRWHYHNFMAEMYRRLHVAQQTQAYRDFGDEYCLLRIARDVLEESTVLAIDEFQLPDPGAAAIVRNFFLYFFRLGGVLVATSNRLPDNLYATGFGTDAFNSFAKILSSRCEVYEMHSELDYRKNRAEDESAPYFCLHGHDDIRWTETVNRLLDGKECSETILQVYGRPVHVAQAYGDTAYMTFNELCARNLGAADYISIASRFPTLILDEVPVMSLLMKNEARRFITLIDALYESRTKLLVRAAAEPEELFFPETTTVTDEVSNEQELLKEVYARAHIDTTSPYRPNVTSYDTRTGESFKSLSPTTSAVDYGQLNKFTGEDEKFAFKRAVSRLHEMKSERWWENCEWMPVSHRTWEVERAEGALGSATRQQEQLATAAEDKEANIFSPFRKTPDPPPKISNVHMWGTVDNWGKKAGFWGLGSKIYREKSK